MRKALEELADAACQNWESTEPSDPACVSLIGVSGIRVDTIEVCEFDERRFGLRYTRDVGPETALDVVEIHVETDGGWLVRSYWIRTMEAA